MSSTDYINVQNTLCKKIYLYFVMINLKLIEQRNLKINIFLFF